MASGDDALIVKLLKSHDNYSMQLDYLAGTNPIYVGEAEPSNADVTQPVWRIKKITWDGNNNPTAIAWVNGDRGFSYIWNNRATYTYK
jgi:hypothetical protein